MHGRNVDQLSNSLDQDETPSYLSLYGATALMDVLEVKYDGCLTCTYNVICGNVFFYMHKSDIAL